MCADVSKVDISVHYAQFVQTSEILKGTSNDAIEVGQVSIRGRRRHCAESVPEVVEIQPIVLDIHTEWKGEEFIKLERSIQNKLSTYEASLIGFGSLVED